MSSGRRFFAFAMLMSMMIGIPAAHAETITIVMDKMAFAPTETHAKVGDTISWVNNDIFAHTATTRTGPKWDIVIASKKTATLVLKDAGTFDYYCRFHPNMKGRIVVSAK